MAQRNFSWNGAGVKSRMKRAQIAGINATMGACVTHAKNNHQDWDNQTATLEGGINLVDYAHPVARGVEGLWGVQDVVYARILELGGTIRPVKAKELAIPQPGGGVVLVQSVTIPAKPYLRPAADEQYPKLSMNIRRAYAADTRPLQ